MIRIFSVVLTAALALAASTAAAAGLDEVKQKGSLRVAVYKDFPPYSYLSGGTMRGIDVDVARELAERLGVGLTTMNLTASDEAMEDDLRNAVWKGHYLGGGTADVMMHVPVDRELAENNDQVTIFAPYFQEQFAVAHDKSVIESIPTLLVFSQNRIAVELETFPDTWLSSVNGGRFRHNVAHYRTVDAACEALRNGEIPAWMGHRAQLESCLKDATGDYGIVPVDQGRLFSWSIGMAIKPEHEDLKQALDAAIEEMRNDGVLEALFAAHGVAYAAPTAAPPVIERTARRDDD